jgi:two-component system, cell cycle response regulator
MKILIADDDGISRKMMGMMLRQMGYEVVTAVNGRDALDKLLDADGPRLALLDWMMPEMDGPEVCRSVRAANGQLYVYLILLTSKDTPEALVEGLDAGADEYLTKPCHSDELKARLRTGERILQLEDKLVSAREEMRFKATHDALTSLWNRGRILEALDEALVQLDSVAILMCDIDHFKAINDEHGHLVGDAVLRELAVRLRRGVRPTDLIGRFGGEEFLIVLNRCDPPRLQERAEQLRRAASEGSVQTDAGEVSFTVSIGAVSVNREDSFTPAETVLNLADAALYQAKREGRDRVVIARRLVRSMAC